MKDVPLQAYPEDDEEIEYDSDGNPIAPPRTKVWNITSHKESHTTKIEDSPT